MIIHNSFSDFVLFLYVHMAMVDGSVHDAEQVVILRKMDNLYSSEKNKKFVLAQALEEYRTLNQDSISMIIKESFDHFEEARQNKQKIYIDMFDIINSDGVVDEKEVKALALLNDIIHLTTVAG